MIVHVLPVFIVFEFREMLHYFKLFVSERTTHLPASLFVTRKYVQLIYDIVHAIWQIVISDNQSELLGYFRQQKCSVIRIDGDGQVVLRLQ
jgi:hypothetical protein